MYILLGTVSTFFLVFFSMTPPVVTETVSTTVIVTASRSLFAFFETGGGR